MATLESQFGVNKSASAGAYLSVRSLFFVGKEELKGSTLEVLNGMSDFSFSQDGDKVEVSSWGDPIKVYKRGRIDNSLSFSAEYLAGDEVSHYLVSEAFKLDKLVPFALVVDAAEENSPVWKGVFRVHKSSPSFGNGDAIKFSIEGSLQGPVEETTLNNVKSLLNGYDEVKKRVLGSAVPVSAESRG